MPRKTVVNLWVTSPIDWWSGLVDLSRYNASDFAGVHEEPADFQLRVDELLQHAKKLALKHGWEGDISQGPFLGAIPRGDDNPDLVVAWKQSNNGLCFIASHELLMGRRFDQQLPHQASY